MIQSQIFHVHIHLRKVSLLKVNHLRVRNFEEDLHVGRKFVLQHVHDVIKGLHFFASDTYRVGIDRVSRASAWRNFTANGTVKTRTCRKGENGV